MLPQVVDFCLSFSSSSSSHPPTLIRPTPRLSPLLSIFPPFPNQRPSTSASSLFCACGNGGKRPQGAYSKGKGGGDAVRVKAKAKENIWSVDNDAAKQAAATAVEKKRRRKRTGRAVKGGGQGKRDSPILVSGAMLMEVETVLETQEPVIKPDWDIFISCVCGTWKGVGAVFSPLTAEMEPIAVGKKNENLYDCYTLSYCKCSSSGGNHPQIHRKTKWVTLNPFGEIRHNSKREISQHYLNREVRTELPSHESFNYEVSDILEEELIRVEPGLVFFEDGSYSRGPVDIPVGEFDESKYFLSPTFKFEQCLVKGCNKRLRIMHTIEFSEGGSNIQIIRVAVYEEQLAKADDIHDESDLQLELKPFSQRKRTQPSELTGSWKVFEVSATPTFSEDAPEYEGVVPYAYLCTETLKKRSIPENELFFREEEIADIQDVTVLWLPGGVTGYVDVNKDGILCIGFGWYSDEGINLVMERDYGMDGKLKEVRYKSEVKRRWSEPLVQLK